MTIHDDRDDARSSEALGRALDALAGVGAGGADPAALLGVVRGRVRRRRAAKQAGIGATSLAVSGALAVGGVQLAEQPGPAPVPPAHSPTATPSPTPSASRPAPHRAQPLPQPHPSSSVLPDCTGQHSGISAPDLSALPDAVRDKALQLFQAATTCDAGALIAMEAEDGTSSLRSASPEEFWTRGPDDPNYLSLVSLLAQTTPASVGEGSDRLWVWPSVYFPEHAHDATAWAELRRSALWSSLYADMQARGEYLGWRVGIREDGTWQFFTGGD